MRITLLSPLAPTRAFVQDAPDAARGALMIGR
jgi:hypothetical protein